MIAKRYFPLGVVVALALAYCVWLGVHWLPLGWSAGELSASASRVWDVKQELGAHGKLPFWTPNFMSGSSYALNYARGFYMLPWLAFTTFTDLETAGKLTVLLAIFASALAMYFCARRLLRQEWAAVLAALAFMLYPQQLNRGLGAEHVTISLFFPFIPLMWLTFARALESRRLADIAWCAMAIVGGLWVDNKQAVIHCVYLTGYLIYWLWPAERRRQWRVTAKTCAGIALATAVLSAAIVVPGMTEQKLVKVFIGDPIAEWQKTYSFKSLLSLVDRNGIVSAAAREGVMRQVQAQGGVRSQEELDAVRTVMNTQTESAEKYVGLVLLALVAVTVLWNVRRQDRQLFWLFIALLLLSVMLGSGVSTVGGANARMISAWFGLAGVTGIATLGGVAALLATGVFLWHFVRRKLTTRRKVVTAVVAMLVFLFLPAFRMLSVVPLYSDIRAPYAFFDGPAAFFCAILLGFLVTDVLDLDRWSAHIPKIVLGVAVLLLLDYWPYQAPAFDNGVRSSTIANLQSAYGALKKDVDPVKVYTLTGRYFHLLGPMCSGKPQVYEAFYNWMAPLGTGLLNQHAFGSWDNHRAFLNLMAARYVVFDKTDSSMAGNQQILALYRQTFPVQIENEDFVIFRNETAHPYVSATTRRCLYVGALTNSPALAVELAKRNFTLVHSAYRQTAGYERVYDGAGASYPPVVESAALPLTDVKINRENHQIIHIALTAPTNCVAVVAESYYPFWKAIVDGQPSEVLRVDCGLMGVEVAGGRHDIVLRYEPPRSYAIAGIVSLLALVSCLGVVVFVRR